MITSSYGYINLKCRHCGSDNIVRNGLTRNGKQRYHCNACGRSSRHNPQPNGYSHQDREQILRAYQERSSLRGLTRTFGVARNTVSSWLKKSRAASALE
jgi:transposase-like protein